MKKSREDKCLLQNCLDYALACLLTFAYCERNPLDVTQDTDFQTVASTT